MPDPGLEFLITETNKVFKEASDRLWSCETVEEIDEVYAKSMGRNTESPRTVSNI